MPYLLDVTAPGKFYTNYTLRFVLPMNCQYSPRLYELLKSYQKTRRKWYFKIDDLKKLLNCEHYQRFPDFRRWALEPAVAEINKYTDINVMFVPHKEGRKVTEIEFLLAKKSDGKIQEAIYECNTALDGQMTTDDFVAMLQEAGVSVGEEQVFWEENEA